MIQQPSEFWHTIDPGPITRPNITLHKCFTNVKQIKLNSFFTILLSRVCALLYMMFIMCRAGKVQKSRCKSPCCQHITRDLIISAKQSKEYVLC
ncbi:hypothetical protein XENTR_v10001924 [Xenopus tropicalis]|nr:hypothetical protein XENTR_v10001924 [Xenopus tropicalis]